VVSNLGSWEGEHQGERSVRGDILEMELWLNCLHDRTVWESNSGSRAGGRGVPDHNGGEIEEKIRIRQYGFRGTFGPYSEFPGLRRDRKKKRSFQRKWRESTNKGSAKKDVIQGGSPGARSKTFTSKRESYKKRLDDFNGSPFEKGPVLRKEKKQKRRQREGSYENLD